MSDTTHVPESLWTMYWRVEVRRRLEDDFVVRDKELEAIAGVSRSDSGAGGGYRDMGWVFDTAEEAERLAHKLKPELKQAAWPGRPGEGEAVWVRGVFT